MRTKDLTEVAILIAIAVVLEAISTFIPFLHMPQGGSVSLGMLPIFLIAYRKGVGTGLISGFIFGLFNYLLSPFFVHWAQVLIDYGFAFTALGMAGVFKGALTNDRKFVNGMLLGGFLRYLFHGISGMIFFSEYAGNEGAFVYSFILYNLPYMLVSTMLCIFVGLNIKDRIFQNLSA
jgi:thiamine transporter